MGEEDAELELPWKAALDDETFADLGYTTQATSSAMGSDSSQRQEQTPTQQLKHSATSASKFKRKSFSKQLQLLCLQRYAEYAKDYGRIADKHETEQLLHQSYLQFLKEGGDRDASRLSYVEFLKLVRNRRSEINARAQRPKRHQDVLKRKMALTPAKRKLQEERDKIREFIEVIDRTRVIPDPQQQNRHIALQRSAMVQQHTEATIMEGNEMKSPSPVLSDPMEQMEAILRIQQETRKVQREIAARLRSVSRVIQQHESQEDFEEPSSASV